MHAADFNTRVVRSLAALTMSVAVAVVWIITCLIWSTVWLFIKIGVNDVPPVSFAAMRLLIAILVMVPVTLAGRTPAAAEAEGVAR